MVFTVIALTDNAIRVAVVIKHILLLVIFRIKIKSFYFYLSIFIPDSKPTCWQNHFIVAFIL